MVSDLLASALQATLAQRFRMSAHVVPLPHLNLTGHVDICMVEKGLLVLYQRCYPFEDLWSSWWPPFDSEYRSKLLILLLGYDSFVVCCSTL
jgi:hypothetical protein